ncbi:hypothetical protein GCM10010252_73250 [Streptomyces aureoverticillatus]|nr:hypothetical protein GCM10010252_73250 [Streptomyces aureoverticillatus]
MSECAFPYNALRAFRAFRTWSPSPHGQLVTQAGQAAFDTEADEARHDGGVRCGVC